MALSGLIQGNGGGLPGIPRCGSQGFGAAWFFPSSLRGITGKCSDFFGLSASFPQMKIVFNLLIVAVAVMAGWFFHPKLYKLMEDRKAHSAKQRSLELAAAIKEMGMVPKNGSGAAGAPAAPPPPSAASQLAESLRSGSSSSGTLPGAPSKILSTPAPPKPAVAQVDEIEAKYPLPQFREITDITKDWTSIPSRAFPRQVKTLTAINLEGPSGRVPLPENSDALAMGMTQGMLVIMKSRSDPARSLVPLANTNLKETLTKLYDEYKAYKTSQVMKQRERARALKSRANGATDAEMAAAGPRPKVEAGGVVTAMIASLRAKEIKEVQENRITAWGEINLEKIDGKDYWTGTIQCDVDNAIFGPIPTEIMALIRDDKVVKWLYSGSKEEVN